MRTLVPLVAVVFLAACGTAEDVPGTLPAPEPAPASLLVVHSFDASKGMYIEGYAWHLEVVDENGAEVYSEDLVGPERMVIPVEPGRYTVRSAERACDGNCDYLDPPQGACELTVDVPAGDIAVKISAAAGRACKPTVA
jgi:hypothetical protein